MNDYEDRMIAFAACGILAVAVFAWFHKPPPKPDFRFGVTEREGR